MHIQCKALDGLSICHQRILLDLSPVFNLNLTRMPHDICLLSFFLPYVFHSAMFPFLFGRCSIAYLICLLSAILHLSPTFVLQRVEVLIHS